jgi:hypothetical protein
MENILKWSKCQFNKNNCTMREIMDIIQKETVIFLITNKKKVKIKMAYILKILKTLMEEIMGMLLKEIMISLIVINLKPHKVLKILNLPNLEKVEMLQIIVIYSLETMITLSDLHIKISIRKNDL